jgi:hypothetical protein
MNTLEGKQAGTEREFVEAREVPLGEGRNRAAKGEWQV